MWCHSPGASSITPATLSGRAAAFASAAATHRRPIGTSKAAPKTSVRKPGTTSSAAPSVFATSGVRNCKPATPSLRSRSPSRARSRRPDCLSSTTPSAEVATRSIAAQSQPTTAASRRKQINSAAGSASNPIKIHLTNDMNCTPAKPCWRHGSDRLCSCPGRPAPRQASGSVGSRAYIVIPGTYVCLGRFPVRLPFGSRALRQPRA